MNASRDHNSYLLLLTNGEGYAAEVVFNKSALAREIEIYANAEMSPVAAIPVVDAMKAIGASPKTTAAEMIRAVEGALNGLDPLPGRAATAKTIMALARRFPPPGGPNA